MDGLAEHSGKTVHNDSPSIGIDRYHKWNSDIELIKQLGIKHYRTSISMSRILKNDGSVNASAIEWYSTYFKALQKAGITIYATLYHWELPLYLHAEGGWKNSKTIAVFVNHARTVARELGPYIEEYFILNEPWCASLLSYHLGIHAPGETSLDSGLLAAHNLLLAQGRAFIAIREVDPHAKISTVVNTETAYAYSEDPADIQAAKRSDGYFNRWFIDPLFLGSYPQDMVELYGEHMPKITPSEMKEICIGSSLTTLGINYYCGRIIKWDDTKELNYTSILKDGGPTNDLGWPICIPPTYPEGLYDMLQQIWYSYKIMVTPYVYH
jgi:beta-glucosidase